MDIIKEQIDELIQNQTHILNAIKYLDERMKTVEDKTVETQGSDIRDILQSQGMLDEMVVKSCDDILVMKKAKEENANAIKLLDSKIENINKELEMTRKKVEDKEETANKPHKSRNFIECKLCDKSFNRFSDLENHIREKHEKHEEVKCDVLHWRLRKHMKVHSEEAVGYCYYFNNNHKCPFEEIGCKFLHKEAKTCIFGKRCHRRLCPFKHSNKEYAKNDMKASINEEHVNIIETTNSRDEDFLFNEAVFTSTPKKVNYECEECDNITQCTDCFVRQFAATGQITHGIRKKKRQVHF